MEAEKKKKLVQAFKIIGFMLAVFAVNSAMYFGAYGVPDPTGTFRTFRLNRVFSEKDESIDVVFLGHSAAYSAITPMEMYDEYGITGFAYAQPLMVPWESYDCLKTLFKTQKPKAVAVEAGQFFYDSFKIMINSHAKRAVLALFPFYEAHMIWREGAHKPTRDGNKGYVFSSSVQSLEDKGFAPTDGVYEMHKSHRKYLDQIYELCKANGAEMILFEVPTRSVWTYDMHNYIQNYADGHGLKFLDMNVETERGPFIDFTTDTRDGGDHLNYYGARKTTKYFGDWLHENTDLPDRRGVEGFEYYAADLIEYKGFINARVPNRFDTPDDGQTQSDEGERYVEKDK